jgi:hypothetical protein
MKSIGYVLQETVRDVFFGKHLTKKTVETPCSESVCYGFCMAVALHKPPSLNP